MPRGSQLDLLMDIISESRFKKRHSNLTKLLTKELHFDKAEIESLLLIYYKLQNNGTETPGVNKTRLREILHAAFDMTDEDMTSTVVMNVIKGPSPVVSMEGWVRLMSLFLRGSQEEKIRYCYSCYDTLNRGKIRRDIMLRFMSNCLISGPGEDDSEDSIRDLVEILTKKLDCNGDGDISLDDFRQACQKQPLLIECLGQCLPSRLTANSFLTTFTHKVRKF